MKEHILEAYEQDDGSITYERREETPGVYQAMLHPGYEHADLKRVFGNVSIGTGGLIALGSAKLLHSEYQTTTQQPESHTPNQGLALSTGVGLGMIITGLYMRHKAKKTLERIRKETHENIRNSIENAVQNWQERFE